jgi:hypothetical protein
MSATIKRVPEGVWHLAIAVAFTIAYSLLSPEAERLYPETRERLVENVIVFFMAYVLVKSRSIASAADSAQSGIADLTQRIIEDERIIFLRSSPHSLHTPRDIQVIGIEHPGTVPDELPKPLSCAGESGEWGLSVSILRFDRMQDLLFSGPYIIHFVKLSRAAKHSARILIVNDEPRCRSAVSAFLHFSEGLEIATYIYTKREYYAMVDAVRRATWLSKFRFLPQILKGNPDLSIAVETFAEFVPQPVSRTADIEPKSDFLIRFMDDTREIQTWDARNADGAVVDPMAAIMKLAMHESRKGSGVFEKIIASSGGRPENRWTSKHIKAALQPFTKKVSA